MAVAVSFLWVTRLSGIITVRVSSTRGLLPGGLLHLQPRCCPLLHVSPPPATLRGVRDNTDFLLPSWRPSVSVDTERQTWGCCQSKRHDVGDHTSSRLPQFQHPCSEFLPPTLSLLRGSSSHLASALTPLGRTLLTSAQRCNETANNCSNTLRIGDF